MKNTIANELQNVLIVGGGRMGQAIAQGMLRIDGMSANNLTIANPGQEKRDHIAAELGVRTVASAAAGIPASCVVLAVKPAKVFEVCAELVDAGIDATTLVISIAAGVSTDKIANVLGAGVPVVRVMPNTPLLCGCGMSAVSAGSAASDQDCELVRALFASMGQAIIVDESEQDVVCAVSGSGPAYFELFAEVIAQTAASLGMRYEDARELVLQTMLGTARLVIETGQSLPDAIDAVSSPGGTTVAALDAMRTAGVEEALKDGVVAAARRSKELGA